MRELWDVYTIDRRVTGKTCFRGEQRNLSKDDFHLWVMVWIRNPQTGKYLISQRSADKDTDPLKWETVAGHAIAGETSLGAALREVYEEVGITLSPGDAQLLATKVATTYDGHRHNWIRDSFYFETTEEPDLHTATTKEVLQTRWLSFSEFKEMYERGDCCLNMGDLYGFELNPVPADRYRSIIGQTVKGKIDRPMGSCHPRHKEMIYPVNYGYVPGVMGGDGAEQDIYHSGEIRSFPNAKFFVNRIELETEEVKALKDHPGLTPVDFTDGPYYNFTRSQIIAPGVRMLPAPGHTYGNSIVIAEDGGLFYMIHGDISYTDEAMYADKLSIVYDDIHLARSTQNTIREFIRNHPTVYCSTHTPLGYENLEAKRVMDLGNPPETIWPDEDYFVQDEATGKYICSVCGYVYDPAEHDGVAFEDLPDDWKCPRCKQSKEKFNKA